MAPTRRRQHHSAATTDETFTIATYRELCARASRLRVDSADDAFDVIQRCGERLLNAAPGQWTGYDSPAVLAAVLLRTAVQDHRRGERIQRGQGSRLAIAPDGLRTPGRIMIALDDLDLTDSRSDLDRVEQRLMLRPLLESLPPRIRTLLWMVSVEGYEIQEAAEHLGWSRCHASRQLSKVRKQARRHAGAS